jgi:acyl carrier protein phosphodiesterase
MNFLAHIYLSNEEPMVKIGNFIADAIRGKKYIQFPKDIQRGILLHREIDTFTDAHPIFRRSKRRLHENYGHYSGVIVDIFYDHFLAKNWKNYSSIPLDVYVDDFYDLLEENFTILPASTQRMLPYMMADNWLLNYANLEGIARVLNGMNRRTKNRSKMNYAIADLKENYTPFETEFTSFFNELRVFANHKLTTIEL